MIRSQKQETIAFVKERFDKMVSAVFVDYQGLDVASVTELRNQLRAADVEYKVVKNTLTRLAIQGQEWADDLGDTLTGMTAIAWSYEDPSAAAKVFKNFRKDNENLKIKAGLVDGKVIDEKTVVDQLATMPGKDELRAKLLATLQAPSQQFVRQLQAPLQNFVYLLAAKKAASGESTGEDAA